MHSPTHTHTTHKYGVAKAERLEARVSYEQKKLFQKAADLLGRSLTDFIVNTLQKTAKQIIREHEIVKLSSSDRVIFIKALLNPPKPNSRLLKAVKRYEKDITN